MIPTTDRMDLHMTDETKQPRKHIRIATLGPEGTSSEQAAKQLFRKITGRDAVDGDVRLLPSYEQAADEVLLGEADRLLVAAAYGGCNHFYMTEDLKPLHEENFPGDTPPYLLAARSRRCQLPDAVRVATHPAPEEVIDQLLANMPTPFEWFKVIPTSSTAEAARMVAEGEVEVALTTEPARRRFGLIRISSTKIIPMFWLVFTKAA